MGSESNDSWRLMVFFLEVLFDCNWGSLASHLRHVEVKNDQSICQPLCIICLHELQGLRPIHAVVNDVATNLSFVHQSAKGCKAELLIVCYQDSLPRRLLNGHNWKSFRMLDFRLWLLCNMLLRLIILNLHCEEKGSSFSPLGCEVDDSVELLNDHLGDTQSQSNAFLVYVLALDWAVKLEESIFVSSSNADAIVAHWYLNVVLVIGI